MPEKTITGIFTSDPKIGEWLHLMGYVTYVQDYVCENDKLFDPIAQL